MANDTEAQGQQAIWIRDTHNAIHEILHALKCQRAGQMATESLLAAARQEAVDVDAAYALAQDIGLVYDDGRGLAYLTREGNEAYVARAYAVR